MSDIEQHDKRQIRCRMLGHELTFAYCRQGSGTLPCRKIFDCWYEIFPVEDFVREHFTTKQIEPIVLEPKPKMTSLVELIEQARKRASSDQADR